MLFPSEAKARTSGPTISQKNADVSKNSPLIAPQDIQLTADMERESKRGDVPSREIPTWTRSPNSLVANLALIWTENF